MGLVLAGGKSRRFGQDKALAIYAGKTLLETAVMLLRGVGLRPIVVTRLAAEYPFLDCPVLRDKLPDMGPVGGLYTAMSAFGTDFLVLTCDMPLLRQGTLTRLLSESEGAPLTLFRRGGRVEPFPGVYRHSLLPGISSNLLHGQLSMAELVARTADVRTLEAQDAESEFLNVNRREDLLTSPVINRTKVDEHTFRV